MTVKELIEELQKFDENREVKIGYEWMEIEIEEVMPSEHVGPYGDKLGSFVVIQAED